MTFLLDVPKYRYSMVKEANTEFLQASILSTSTPNTSDSTAVDDLQKVLSFF
jgi:hypothetical protein